MSKYGLHSGRAKFKSVVADEKHVPNMLLLRKTDFDGTNVSGAVASAKAVGQTIPIDAYAFGEDPSGDVSVSFSTVVPSGIPESTRADIRLYWTISGVPSGLQGTDVVWDVHFRTISVIQSGALNTNKNYVISGHLVRATTTGKYVGGNATREQPSWLSGALVQTIVSIPSGNFRAGDVLQGMINRNSAQTADTLNSEAYLLYAMVEYV